MINLHPDFIFNLFFLLFLRKSTNGIAFILLFIYFFIFILFLFVSLEHEWVSKKEILRSTYVFLNMKHATTKVKTNFLFLSFGITNIGCRYYYFILEADFLGKIDLRMLNLMWRFWWLEGRWRSLFIRKVHGRSKEKWCMRKETWKIDFWLEVLIVVSRNRDKFKINVVSSSFDLKKKFLPLIW